ncbi:MAG: Ig-like domain-containing protein, partial [Oscillospiraceae bacterium]
MKHVKQKVGMSHRIMGLFLTVCMVASLFLPIVSAQAEESTSNPISLCGFVELPNEIKEQSIPLGISLEKLNLPDTLEALMVAPSSNTEPVTIHSVTWESSPLYDENVVGEYIFTATLPQPYVLAEGVALPKISITVYDDKTASKIVTSWQWDDPNGYISEGVLELPGVSKENPINLDALVSMLPTSILATLNPSEPSNTSTPSEGSESNAPVSIPLGWSSKDFVQTQDGSFPVQGEYKFTATMQEGYALLTDAPPLEITLRLGGTMLLPSNGIPSNGTFTTLELREGSAIGTVVVNLLDKASMAGNWALKPGKDYYLCADLIAPTGAEHIKIYYGGADAPNGVTFANPPGGKYVPNKFTTHDYLDELLSYTNLTDPTYGPKKLEYAMQDGEMIYHIKKNADTSTNTVVAIGLVVKDAMYDGSGSIKNAVSVAVGSYVNNTFTPAPASDSTQTFDLKIAEKGGFNSYLSPKILDAAIGAKGANGSMQYLANISSTDQPEILYDEVSFDLTYPIGAELEIGLDQSFSKTHTSLGTMTVGDAVPNADKKTQTVHVVVQDGLKAAVSHGACSVRLNFPDNGVFKPGEEYFLTTANVK